MKKVKGRSLLPKPGFIPVTTVTSTAVVGSAESDDVSNQVITVVTSSAALLQTSLTTTPGTGDKLHQAGRSSPVVIMASSKLEQFGAQVLVGTCANTPATNSNVDTGIPLTDSSTRRDTPVIATPCETLTKNTSQEAEGIAAQSKNMNEDHSVTISIPEHSSCTEEGEALLSTLDLMDNSDTRPESQIGQKTEVDNNSGDLHHLTEYLSTGVDDVPETEKQDPCGLNLMQDPPSQNEDKNSNIDLESALGLHPVSKNPVENTGAGDSLLDGKSAGGLQGQIVGRDHTLHSGGGDAMASNPSVPAILASSEPVISQSITLGTAQQTYMVSGRPVNEPSKPRSRPTTPSSQIRAMDIQYGTPSTSQAAAGGQPSTFTPVQPRPCSSPAGFVPLTQHVRTPRSRSPSPNIFVNVSANMPITGESLFSFVCFKLLKLFKQKCICILGLKLVLN